LFGAAPIYGKSRWFDPLLLAVMPSFKRASPGKYSGIVTVY
jgi:hypothetical protein